MACYTKLNERVTKTKCSYLLTLPFTRRYSFQSRFVHKAGPGLARKDKNYQNCNQGQSGRTMPNEGEFDLEGTSLCTVL